MIVLHVIFCSEVTRKLAREVFISSDGRDEQNLTSRPRSHARMPPFRYLN